MPVWAFFLGMDNGGIELGRDGRPNPAMARESEGRAEVGPPSGVQELSSVALYDGFPSSAPRKCLIGVIRLGFFMCAGHGTVLTGESPVTGIYRQV